MGKQAIGGSLSPHVQSSAHAPSQTLLYMHTPAHRCIPVYTCTQSHKKYSVTHSF